MVRGRKKRRNIRKLVARNPPTAVQMMRRRIVLTGSGGALSTVLDLAAAEVPTAGLAAALGFSCDADAFCARGVAFSAGSRSEEHTSELQSRLHLGCRLLL